MYRVTGGCQISLKLHHIKQLGLHACVFLNCSATLSVCVFQRTQLNACLFAQQQRYRLALVLDSDELVVPVDGSRTYQQYFHRLEQRMARRNVTLDHYSSFQPQPYYIYGRRAVHEHLPLLTSARYSLHKRWNSKTFQNTATCQFAGIHKCERVHDDVIPDGTHYSGVLPLDDMVLHHYRKQCSIPKLCGIRANVSHSSYFAKTFGTALKRRVETVLKDISYHRSPNTK